MEKNIFSTNSRLVDLIGQECSINWRAHRQATKDTLHHSRIIIGRILFTQKKASGDLSTNEWASSWWPQGYKKGPLGVIKRNDDLLQNTSPYSSSSPSWVVDKSRSSIFVINFWHIKWMGSRELIGIQSMTIRTFYRFDEKSSLASNKYCWSDNTVIAPLLVDTTEKMSKSQTNNNTVIKWAILRWRR